MKNDVLAVIDVYATGMQCAVWLWTAAALFLTGAAAWLLIRIGRRLLAAFTRATQVVRHEVGPDALRLLQDLDTHLDQTVAHDPHLAAAYDRLDAAINQPRKETP